MTELKRQLLSPCHNAPLKYETLIAVNIGSCTKCRKYVMRTNPRTDQDEWLDGNSAWSEHELRPISDSDEVPAPRELLRQVLTASQVSESDSGYSFTAGADQLSAACETALLQYFEFKPKA